MKLNFRLATVALSGFAALSIAGVASAQEVTGAGASFPAPLYSKWAADYNKATGVRINYQSVGSGAGLRQIDAKTVAFGASDMPLPDGLGSISFDGWQRWAAAVAIFALGGLIAGLGSIVFALADTLGVAVIGRALVGLGEIGRAHV